jgi:hypothetical protein
VARIDDRPVACGAVKRVSEDMGYNREVGPFNDEFYAHHWFEKRLTRS